MASHTGRTSFNYLALRPDAGLMEAQVRSYLIEQMQVRRAVASQSQAAQTMAAGSALAGFAAWQQMMQPRSPITCQPVGALVTCR
jgi:hypothetical protein